MYEADKLDFLHENHKQVPATSEKGRHVKVKHGYVHKPFEELTLADDYMFVRVMSDVGIAKQFFEHLYGRDIKNIEKVVPQSTKDVGYDSHAIRFDVEFTGDDTIYDIEMESRTYYSEKSIRDLFYRTRYYQSVIDTQRLQKGNEYDTLPETHIIFICRFDIFGEGLSKYTQGPAIKELYNWVDNGTEVIYLNTRFTTCNVCEEIKDFLNYIESNDASAISTEFIELVNKKVELVKRDENDRRDYMSLDEMIKRYTKEAREEAREEGMEEGMEKGREEERQRVIDTLIKRGYSKQEAYNLIMGLN